MERDALLFESSFDVCALYYVTYMIYRFDVASGVDPVLAFGAGFINWAIQIIVELAGNYIIFYLRQKRNVFTRRTTIEGQARFQFS